MSKINIQDALKGLFKDCPNGKMIYDDRQFEFKMANPWDGCSLFSMMHTHKLPFDAMFHPYNELPEMTGEELKDLQMFCLKNCYECLPASKAPVIDGDGEFGTPGEITSPLLYYLTIGYLLFFEKSWSDADRFLSNLAVQVSSQQKPQTSTVDSSHQSRKGIGNSTN